MKQVEAAQEAIALTALRSLLSALRPYTENFASHGETHCNFCGRSQGEWVRYDSKWKRVHRDGCPIGLATLVLSDPSKAATVLLERLAELETLPQQLENLSVATTVLSEQLKQAEAKVEDLHGALRSIQLSLGLANDMLMSPGPMVGKAQDFIEEALRAVREELE